MNGFYEPDLTANPDSPFVRDASNKLVRRSYWMDMTEKTLVTVMTQGVRANLKGKSVVLSHSPLSRDQARDWPGR